jgi:hypothetical protein
MQSYNVIMLINHEYITRTNKNKARKVIDFDTINFANWLWAILFVPLAWYMKAYMKSKNDNKIENDKLIEKALKNLSNDELRRLIKEEIAHLVVRQDSLESDFKDTNKSFHEFTQSFYAKINEVMLSIVGLKK